MSITDEQIGKNLSRLRGEMSQADLADKMRERGYKWSQATVWAVEKGERPLRLTEAQDVANILNVFSHRLTDHDAVSVLEARMHVVSDAHRELKGAIERYHEAQLQLMFEAESSDLELENTPLGSGIIDWLGKTAADIEREIRIEDSANAQAENATWAYLLAKESGESPREVLESMNGGGQVMDGPYARALNEAWKEFEDFSLVPAEENVGGTGDDSGSDDAEAAQDQDGYGLAAKKRSEDRGEVNYE